MGENYQADLAFIGGYAAALALRPRTTA